MLWSPGSLSFPTGRDWSWISHSVSPMYSRGSTWGCDWRSHCLQWWTFALTMYCRARWWNTLQIWPIFVAMKYNKTFVCFSSTFEHVVVRTCERRARRFSTAERRVGHSNLQITNRVLPLFRSLHLHGGVLCGGGGWGGHEAFLIQMQMGELSAAKTWWIMGCTKSRALNKEMKEGLFSTPLISL